MNARSCQAAPTIEALLFDLDGTLIDSARDLTLSVVEAFRLAGFDPPPQPRVAALLGAPLEEMAAALGYRFTREENERMFRAFRAHYPEHWLDHTAPFQGVTELLPRLSRRYRLAVVTTKRQAQADRLVEALGFGDFFSHVQGWQEGFRHKPAPDLVLATLRALAVAPGGAVMIGDTFRDLEAGKAAGCATVAVTYGAGREEDLRRHGPDGVAGSFAELEEVVERLRSRARG